MNSLVPFRIISVLALFLTAAMPVLAGSGDEEIYPLRAGDYDEYQVQSPDQPHSVTIDPDRHRNGEPSYRFELRAGEVWTRDGEPAGHRSEVSERFRASYGEEYWYGFSMYVPSDFTGAGRRTILGQWNTIPDRDEGEVARSPVLSQSFHQGRFEIAVRWSSERVQTANDGERRVIYETEDFPRDTWVDFVYHVRWSYADDGRVRVWMDGEPVADYHGPVGYNDALGPYFKFGLYRADIDDTAVVWFDAYRRGGSHREVSPTDEGQD